MSLPRFYQYFLYLRTRTKVHMYSSVTVTQSWCFFFKYIRVTAKDPVWIDTGPLPFSAWAGWMCFDSEAEMKAAQGVQYRRLMLRAVQLLSEVYTSYWGEGLRCNVRCRRGSPNFQKANRAQFSSLWKEATAAMTVLVYSGLHTRLYRGYVQVYRTACTQVHAEANRLGLHKSSFPSLWKQPKTLYR